MTSAPPPLTRHDDGVTTIDAEYVRPGFASIHVLERQGHAAIVDTGANASVPLVLDALRELGLGVDAVELLFLTHVHLDHAGGAGALLRHLPNARVLVHPRGAPHVVDPSRLQAATIAVYGQSAFDQLYGELVPIAETRVHPTRDGDRVQLGASELLILHTPGHALHHQVLFDPGAKAVFTGDTFGLSYRELDTDNGTFVVPTTTPTQFDPEQLLASVERIAALNPTSVYLTHYGRIMNATKVAVDLREQIQAFVEIARKHAGADDPQASIRRALREYLAARAKRHGIVKPLAMVDRVLGPDLDLNAQGLVAWLARADKKTA